MKREEMFTGGEEDEALAAEGVLKGAVVGEVQGDVTQAAASQEETHAPPLRS